MFIVFKAKKEVKSEVFLEITAGPSRAYDLNVTQSLIKGNSGRGESHPFKFIFHNFLRVLVHKNWCVKPKCMLICFGMAPASYVHSACPLEGLIDFVFKVVAMSLEIQNEM